MNGLVFKEPEQFKPDSIYKAVTSFDLDLLFNRGGFKDTVYALEIYDTRVSWKSLHCGYIVQEMLLEMYPTRFDLAKQLLEHYKKALSVTDCNKMKTAILTKEKLLAHAKHQAEDYAQREKMYIAKKSIKREKEIQQEDPMDCEDSRIGDPILSPPVIKDNQTVHACFEWLKQNTVMGEIYNSKNLQQSNEQGEDHDDSRMNDLEPEQNVSEEKNAEKSDQDIVIRKRKSRVTATTSTKKQRKKPPLRYTFDVNHKAAVQIKTETPDTVPIAFLAKEQLPSTQPTNNDFGNDGLPDNFEELDTDYIMVVRFRGKSYFKTPATKKFIKEKDLPNVRI